MIIEELSIKQLFKAYIKAPSLAQEKRITRAIKKTEWHTPMSGKGLENLPLNKRTKSKKDLKLNCICMPIDDDCKKAVSFFESAKDLEKWFQTIENDPDYVLPGEEVHDMSYLGKDLDPRGYSKDIKAFVFHPKGFKESLKGSISVYRKDFPIIFNKK